MHVNLRLIELSKERAPVLSENLFLGDHLSSWRQWSCIELI